VVATTRSRSVRWLELAEQQIESAAISLTDDIDPIPDQKGSTHPLTRLVSLLRAKSLVDDLGTAGSADVHQEGEPDAVVLRDAQHRLGGREHPIGPVLSTFAQDASRAIEHVEPVPPVDVRRLSRRAECEVLGAKADDMDVGKSNELIRVRVRSSIRGPVDSTRPAQQAPTHQELERTLLGESRPRSDLHLTRQMPWADHKANCVKENWCEVNLDSPMYEGKANS
jgi:hypothetical protein